MSYCGLTYLSRVEIEDSGLNAKDMADMAALEKDMDSTTTRDDSENAGPASPSAASSKSALAHSNKPKGGVMPSGAMPTTKSGGLSNVANEFWFPESRNCPCCKGYKHGCKCRVGSVQVCTDPGCTSTAASIEDEVKLEPVNKERTMRVPPMKHDKSWLQFCLGLEPSQEKRNAIKEEDSGNYGHILGTRVH